jgi:hypothetical protein
MRNAVRKVQSEAANRPACLSARVLSRGAPLGAVAARGGLTGLFGCRCIGQSITAGRRKQERRVGRASESTAPIPSPVRTAAPDHRTAPHYLTRPVAYEHGSTSTHVIPSGPYCSAYGGERSPSYTRLREGAALSGAGQMWRAFRACALEQSIAGYWIAC